MTAAIGAYLEVAGASRRFGGVQALRDCSFTVQRNSTTCLVGPNGAGKTTVFNAITGFMRLDAGRVTFDGRVVSGLAPGKIIRAGIARTFQTLRLFEEMTVLENVIVYLRDGTATDPLSALVRPFHTQAAMRRKREAAMALLTEVGIAEKSDQLARNMSYGQQKLLCIARVLATGADLLLLDEPTSGLSQSALAAMVEMVERLRARGHTLLVVEHNTKIVQRIADAIVFLHQGSALAQGTPAAILGDPRLTEIYFG